MLTHRDESLISDLFSLEITANLDVALAVQNIAESQLIKYT